MGLQVDTEPRPECIMPGWRWTGPLLRCGTSTDDRCFEVGVSSGSAAPGFRQRWTSPGGSLMLMPVRQETPLVHSCQNGTSSAVDDGWHAWRNDNPLNFGESFRRPSLTIDVVDQQYTKSRTSWSGNKSALPERCCWNGESLSVGSKSVNRASGRATFDNVALFSGCSPFPTISIQNWAWSCH